MGVPIRNKYLYSLNFVDDQVVIVQEEEDLSYMVRKLEINFKKLDRDVKFRMYIKQLYSIWMNKITEWSSMGVKKRDCPR